jgi:hypothetical protein
MEDEYSCDDIRLGGSATSTHGGEAEVAAASAGLPGG